MNASLKGKAEALKFQGTGIVQKIITLTIDHVYINRKKTTLKQNIIRESKI